MSCPECKSRGFNKPDNYIMINDGGSKECSSCKRIYHICCGKVKYGSPGPNLCKYCNPDKLRRVRFY